MSTSEPSTAKTTLLPNWYSFQTTPSGTPYVCLPAKTSRPPIYLTPFSASDSSRLQTLLNIPSVNERLISVPTPYTTADAEFWIDLQCSGTNCLHLQALRSHDPESGSFIGAVRLSPTGLLSSSTEYELGYYLDPAFQRLGIMRDAVLAELAWGVVEMGIVNLKVDVAETNLASCGLIQSLGWFEREGEMKEVEWPGSKGGGTQRLLSWRWRADEELRRGES